MQECVVLDEDLAIGELENYLQIPIDKSLDVFTGLSTTDVSFYWRMLFYCEICGSCFSLIQILFATLAFNTKRETCVDYLVFPCTIINLLMQFVIFTGSHIARWSRAGKICAGDYLSETDFKLVEVYQEFITLESQSSVNVNIDNVNMYLIMQGKLLKWYIVSMWIVLCLFICCCGCLCCCLSKPTDTIGQGVTTE